MKNKERKKELIAQNKHKEYNQKKYELYKKGIVDEAAERELIDVFGDEDAKALEQLQDARRKQKKKIKNHLEFWMNRDYRIFFVTFTINNENQEKLSKNKSKDAYFKAFKDVCTRSLSFTKDYIINVDFGDENEREHYHALVAYERNACTMRYNGHINKKTHRKEYEDVNINKKYKVGFVVAEEFDYNIDDAGSDKLSRYITKLVVHSIKVKQSYVSVKRNTEYQEYQKKYKLACKVIQNKKISDRNSDDIAVISDLYDTNQKTADYRVALDVLDSLSLTEIEMLENKRYDIEHTHHIDIHDDDDFDIRNVYVSEFDINYDTKRKYNYIEYMFDDTIDLSAYSCCVSRGYQDVKVCDKDAYYCYSYFVTSTDTNI